MLVINKLRVKPRTWKELDAFLKQESERQGYDLTLSQRQFQRHLMDILSLYGISIENNRSRNEYYIASAESSNDSALRAFDSLNVLRLGNNSTDQIEFEKRRPTGSEHLSEILNAIRNKRVIRFEYHKFYESYAEQRKLLPILLKESKNRWYVIGHDMDKDALRVFAVDRMTDLVASGTSRAKVDHSEIRSLFSHCFGIILPKEGQKVEEIILSYSGFQGQYIKTLPLHGSQEILVDNEDEVRVKLHVYVTRDLVMEILSTGAQVKVISPLSLKEMIADEHRLALT